MVESIKNYLTILGKDLTDKDTVTKLGLLVLGLPVAAVVFGLVLKITFNL